MPARYRFAGGSCCCCVDFFVNSTSAPAGYRKLHSTEKTYPDNVVTIDAPLPSAKSGRGTSDYRNKKVFTLSTITAAQKHFIYAYDFNLEHERKILEVARGTLGAAQTIACDWQNQRLFYVVSSIVVTTDADPFTPDQYDHTHDIRRCNYDGSGDQSIATETFTVYQSTTGRGIQHLAWEPNGQYIFYDLETERDIVGSAGWEQTDIIRRNADGTGRTTVVSLSASSTRYTVPGLCFAASRNKVVWIQRKDTTGPTAREQLIRYCDIDGSGATTILSYSYASPSTQEHLYTRCHFNEKDDRVFFLDTIPYVVSPGNTVTNLQKIAFDGSGETTIMDDRQGGWFTPITHRPMGEWMFGCKREKSSEAYAGAGYSA